MSLLPLNTSSPRSDSVQNIAPCPTPDEICIQLFDCIINSSSSYPPTQLGSGCKFHLEQFFKIYKKNYYLEELKGFTSCLKTFFLPRLESLSLTQRYNIFSSTFYLMRGSDTAQAALYQILKDELPRLKYSAREGSLIFALIDYFWNEDWGNLRGHMHVKDTQGFMINQVLLIASIENMRQRGVPVSSIMAQLEGVPAWNQLGLSNLEKAIIDTLLTTGREIPGSDTLSQRYPLLTSFYLLKKGHLDLFTSSPFIWKLAIDRRQKKTIFSPPPQVVQSLARPSTDLLLNSKNPDLTFSHTESSDRFVNEGAILDFPPTLPSPPSSAPFLAISADIQIYNTIDELLKAITPHVLQFFHYPVLNPNLGFDYVLLNFLQNKFERKSIAKVVDLTYEQMEAFWQSLQTQLLQSTLPRSQLSERLWYLLNRLAHYRETTPCACALWITFFRSVDDTLFLDALSDQERQLAKYFWRNDWKGLQQELLKLPPNFDRMQYYFYAYLSQVGHHRAARANVIYFSLDELGTLPADWKEFILKKCICFLKQKNQGDIFVLDCKRYPFIEFKFYSTKDIFNIRKRTIFHLVDLMKIIHNYINNKSQKMGTYLNSAIQSIKNLGYIHPSLAWNNRAIVTTPPMTQQLAVSAPLPQVRVAPFAPTNHQRPILPIIPKDSRLLITNSQLEPLSDFEDRLSNLRNAYQNQSIPRSNPKVLALVRNCMLTIPAYIEQLLSLKEFNSLSHHLHLVCDQRYLDLCIELRRKASRTSPSYETDIFCSILGNFWEGKNHQNKIAALQSLYPDTTAELCEALIGFTCIPEQFGCYSSIEAIQSIATRLPCFYSLAYFSQPLNPFLIFPPLNFPPIVTPLFLQAWKTAASHKGWERIAAYYDSLLAQLKNLKT